MWGSVLGLGVLTALNPVRLGLALLMISRPRPAPNLLAYWIGGLTVCIPELLVPLLLLSFTPLFGSLGRGSGTTTQQINHGLLISGEQSVTSAAFTGWSEHPFRSTRTTASGSRLRKTSYVNHGRRP